MKALRRWTASIAASFDGMVTQFENHEALVASAIREVKVSGTKARIQHEKVRRDGQAMRKRLEELRVAQETWKERAVRTHQMDEGKALECVRRSKRIEKEIAELEEQERNHAKLEAQLAKDLATLDERINQLRRQKHVLSARQYRAEALHGVKNEGTGIISELDEIFDRWEEKVAQYELYNSALPTVDDRLEEEFVSAEEEQTLRESLKALLEQEKVQ